MRDGSGLAARNRNLRKAQRDENSVHLQAALTRAQGDLIHRAKTILTFLTFWGEALLSPTVVRVFIPWTPTEYLDVLLERVERIQEAREEKQS